MANAVVSERRLTSVLFADLVAYTTLAEARDTEDVRALLTEYFDVCSTVVRRYGGTVEKFIGDAVMAVWGVPTAHEDDAERAVRAALDLVDEIEALGERLGVTELALRAGVVTGEVTASLGATDQGMVAGDPVNTASRVQATAGSGEVWVDATTHALTAAAVAYFDAGRHALKGKAEPLQLFRAGSVVAARGGAQRVDGLEAPLVGRERQLRLLKELFHATEDSGRPALVVLDGEAGVGKTRLGWEFEKYADGLERPVIWHRGRCLSYGDGVAFWALAEAVRTRVGVVESDSGVAAMAGVDGVLTTLGLDDAERHWLRPRLASLLGEEAREFAREDLFAAWVRFFERVGGVNPVVLLIDDAQYADQGLLDFLDHLVSHSGAAFFVLLLARPELLETRPQLGGRRASVVRLERLPDAALGDLVDGLVEGLDAETRASLVRRAEGIPLFAVETVRSLIDRDLVQAIGGRYVVAPGRRIDLEQLGAPDSLRALVTARLDALTPDERRVLTDASVLGESFTGEGIGLLAHDVDGLADVLASLRHKELITTDLDRFSAERGQFRFVQSVVRQVAYSTMAKRDRKRRHLLVADHLSNDVDRADDLAQVVAQHLLDAAEASASDDLDVHDLRHRASDLLMTAAERACALGSYADGVRLYDGALAIVSEPAARGRILTRKAMATFHTGQHEVAMAEARSAIELFDLAGDLVGAADAAYPMSYSLFRIGRDEEALECALARLPDVVDRPDAERIAGRLARIAAGALTFLGRFDEAARHIDTALKLADRTGDGETLAAAVGLLAQRQMNRGSLGVAALLYDAQAVFAREHELWEPLSLALGNRAVVFAQRDLRRAIDATEAVNANQVEHGLAPLEGPDANLCTYRWVNGRWSDLPAHLVRLSERTNPLPQFVSSATDQLMVWAGAPSVLDSLAALDDVSAAVYPQGQHFRHMATALASGALTQAVEEGLRCVRAELAANERGDDFHVYLPIAMRAALAQGDPAAVDELLGYQTDLPDDALPLGQRAHRQVFRALVLIRNGDADPAQIEELLMAGIQGLDEYGAVVWAAFAHEDLGVWLTSLGRDAEARAHLDLARATYADLGATTWLARVDESRTAAV